MRVSTSLVATIQQSQVKEKNSVRGKAIDDAYNNDRLRNRLDDEKSHDSKVARIREQLKNGSYKIDLAATADRMAQSLLNL